MGSYLSYSSLKWDFLFCWHLLFFGIHGILAFILCINIHSRRHLLHWFAWRLFHVNTCHVGCFGIASVASWERMRAIWRRPDNSTVIGLTPWETGFCDQQLILLCNPQFWDFSILRIHPIRACRLLDKLVQVSTL